MKIIETIKSHYPGLNHVMFFHSHNLWPSHIETELELMELLKQEGIKISSFVCNGDLVGCDINPKHDFKICDRCISTRKFGYKLIPKDNKIIKIKLSKTSQSIHLEKISSIDELKKFTYKNFDVGFAALSSVVSRVRNPYITYNDYKGEFDSLIQKSIAAYEFFLLQIKEKQPDLVIIFNGRYTYSRALVRACEALGIKYYTHERGANKNKYMLFENTLPHDISYFNKLLQEKWNSNEVKEEEKISIGNQFYVDRAKGIEQSWFSYTKNQNAEEMPEDWDAAKHNVIIYLSSEDEFIAIGDQWGKTIFTNQIEGLRYIFSNVFNDETHKFYIRIHPNSKTLIKFIEEVFTFQNNQVRVIHPDSTISSYKLLFNANKIITFGSTIGIEATYWGKPSINLGNCFYKNLNVTYNPIQLDDVITLIKNTELAPLDNYNTLKYGYYVSTFGYEYEIYKPEGLKKGIFKGENLQTLKGYFDKMFSNKIKRPYRLRKVLQRVEKEIIRYLHNR